MHYVTSNIKLESIIIFNLLSLHHFTIRDDSCVVPPKRKYRSKDIFQDLCKAVRKARVIHGDSLDQQQE